MADAAEQGRQNHAVYGGSAQHNAWKALPNKLAEEDKAAAEAWEVEKLKPVDVDAIKQPIYQETFIQTSADDEGRRTGVRTQQTLGSKNNLLLSFSCLLETTLLIAAAAPKKLGWFVLIYAL
ncbi:hypothetical protein PX690_21395 [Bacillus velezensis]|uniref:hypothetical protein n=1 Tax=Bacillus velezensis TaxID=492670 RepID=UPI0023E1000F|nr:hypothetical protein [Bacillus velezensis]WES02030.1 hypothetical protein PX690_21395 [Bacillus velezensis]